MPAIVWSRTTNSPPCMSIHRPSFDVGFQSLVHLGFLAFLSTVAICFATFRIRFAAFLPNSCSNASLVVSLRGFSFDFGHFGSYVSRIPYAER